MENLAVSLASDADSQRHGKAQHTALTPARVIGFAFPANYINHAPLVGAPPLEFDFNRTLAGLLTAGIFTTHAMLQVPGGHLINKLRQSEARRSATTCFLICSAGPRGLCGAPRILDDLTKVPQVFRKPGGSPALRNEKTIRSEA